MPLPTDDRFSEQWYLLNAMSGEYDLNVVNVWDEFTGRGIKVFVIDTGIEYSHPDLAANYDINLDYDFYMQDADPAAEFASEAHATSVAGIIGAARNGTGVVGVAYGATLVGYGLGGAGITYDSLNAASQAAPDNGADIINVSLATSANFSNVPVARDLRNGVISHAVDTGRDGLGTIIVKGVGNERDNDPSSDINAHAFDSSTEQVIVAGIDRNGFVSGYSTHGAAILVSAFAGVADTPNGLVTTDRVGSNGYTSGDYTQFAGTSGATPQVSGIVALMLEANSALGWRDVQTILAYSARHVGSDVDGTSPAGAELNPWYWNDGSNWNGGGLHFSNDYGYGLVDGLAAVRLAESWRGASTSGNERFSDLNLLSSPANIPDGDTGGAEYSARMNQSIDVERVRVSMSFTTYRADDLEIYLTSPDGTEHRLLGDIVGTYGNAFDGEHFFESQAFRGEHSKGQWSIRVVDDMAGQQITVSDIKLTIWGAADSRNDTYVYTNAFSEFLDTHSKNLGDNNGGVDLLNAAAVTSAMDVNLGKGRGTIDGVTMKITGIENIAGGDGSDRLIGSSAANDISGGRGQDLLSGGNGGDTFTFRAVADSPASAFDTISDFGKGDRISLKRIDTMENDGDQAFNFIRRADFHERNAELRVDITNLKGTRNDFTSVEGDLDGDGLADFAIRLAGVHNLKAGDFMF